MLGARTRERDRSGQGIPKVQCRDWSSSRFCSATAAATGKEDRSCTPWHIPEGTTASRPCCPAYNEEALIERTVRHVAEVVRQLVDDYEIVVVNDGSRDRTGEILAALMATEPDLHLRIDLPHPRTRATARRWPAASTRPATELIFMTDGDKQFDVAEARRSCCRRWTPRPTWSIGWRAQRADPPLRLLNAWGWKQLVNGLFGYTARDIDCAFKLFRRDGLAERARAARAGRRSAPSFSSRRGAGLRHCGTAGQPLSRAPPGRHGRPATRHRARVRGIVPAANAVGARRGRAPRGATSSRGTGRLNDFARPIV